MRVELKTHREKVLADKSMQKLFLLVNFFPEKEEIILNTSINTVFVIDISGSMSDVVPGTVKNKLELAKDSMLKLTNSYLLGPSDNVGLVSYDTSANVIFNMESYNKNNLEAGISKLKIGGGTSMGEGIEKALELFEKSSGNSNNNKIFLFTDGITFDDTKCREMAKKAHDSNVSIVSYGVGEEYNENLLMEISEETNSNARHIEDIKDFFQYISEELASSKKEAIKNANMNFHFSRGFEIEKAYRVFPSIVNYEISEQKIDFGNLFCDKENIFIIDINCPKREASKIRMTKVKTSYELSDGVPKQEEQDLLIEYTDEEFETNRVNEDVMYYLRQYNLQKHIEKAAKEVKNGDYEQAITYLNEAEKTALLSGNNEIFNKLQTTKNELMKNGKISGNTIKSLTVESKTMTMSIKKNNIAFTSEEIRKMTGV